MGKTFFSRISGEKRGKNDGSGEREKGDEGRGGGAEWSQRKALVVPASCQMMPLIASLLVQKQKV